MSLPSENVDNLVLSDIAQRLLEQPELLFEEQTSFPCPSCSKEFNDHTTKEMETCLGYNEF